MNGWTPSALLEARLRAAFDEPPPDPAFVGRLEADLVRRAGQPGRARFAQPVSLPHRQRVWFGTAALALMLVIAVLVVGPQQVLAAIQGIVSYVPGVGFVQDAETALVLSEPVTAVRDGVTVTVEEAVADVTGTRIRLDIAVASGKYQYRIQNQGAALTTGRIRLLLADGTAVEPQAFSVTLDPFLEITAVYAPLPVGTRQAHLALERIPGLEAGEGPEHWDFLLQFVPAEAEERVLPAAEVHQSSETLHGLSLLLENVATQGGHTTLQVRVDAADGAWMDSFNWANQLRLEDVAGRPLPLELLPERQINDRESALLDTPTLESGQTYRLILTGSLKVGRHPERQAEQEFVLDLGPAPLSGQRWDVDVPLNVDGHTARIAAVALFDTGEGYRLSFRLDPPTSAIQSAMIFPTEGGERIDQVGESWLTLTELPQEPLRLRVGTITYRIEGEWVVEWIAP